VVRADTQWLADVIDRLEACPDLLAGTDVVFTDLAVQRGAQLEAPCGRGRVRVRHTSAVRAVREAAAMPVPFAVLVDQLAETFHADRSAVTGMLTDLVRHGFLITCLRAPMTVTDPLSHLLDRLADLNAGALPSVQSLLGELAAIQTDLCRLNASVANADADPRHGLG
jgi:lantibiotic biosynthesis protein